MNLALCLANLRDVVDGAFFAFNGVLGEDLLHTQRPSEMHRGGGDEDEGAVAVDAVSFDALNVRIGRLLAPLFLPNWLYEVPKPLRDLSKNRIAVSQTVKNLHASEEKEAPRRLRYSSSEDVIESLCLDPAMKFFTGMQLPQERITGHRAPTTWSSVLLEAIRSLDGTFTCEGVFLAPPSSSSSSMSCAPFAMASRSCLWALRGYDARREGLRELQDLMASRLPDGAFPLTTLLVSPSEKNDNTWYARTDHEVSLYGHAPIIPRSIAEALRKVEDQVRVGAFIHHFERYGVEKATIEEAMMKLWDTVATYDASLIYS
ncbi:unnamed protein product [Phytomonas sp. Hart1]|nr:unnamed protein product [Phytomonas sp. Hart1]|eukprot:CCW69920.1 unnamed protein product [Phytomonas sp. isolate Hart1]